MTTPKQYLGIVITAVLIIVAGTATWFYSRPDSPTEPVTTSVTSPSATATSTNLIYQGREGVTALDLLKEQAKVEVTSYSFGDMVTSINDIPATDRKTWSFYVNGELAATGASTYLTKDSETIEWRYEDSKF